MDVTNVTSDIIMYMLATVSWVANGCYTYVPYTGAMCVVTETALDGFVRLATDMKLSPLL